MHGLGEGERGQQVQAAALQYVRKITGTSHPSRANQATFQLAVDQIASSTRLLVDSLVTSSAPMNREAEAAKAAARSRRRFA